MSDAGNGYVCEFEVYTGKKGNIVENNLDANVVKNTNDTIQTHVPTCLL